MANTVQELFDKTNWELLRNQKAHLLSILDTAKAKLTPDEHSSLEGILNLLDSYQDTAVDDMGIAKETVFGERQDDAFPIVSTRLHEASFSPEEKNTKYFTFDLVFNSGADETRTQMRHSMDGTTDEVEMFCSELADDEYSNDDTCSQVRVENITYLTEEEYNAGAKVSNGLTPSAYEVNLLIRGMEVKGLDNGKDTLTIMFEDRKNVAWRHIKSLSHAVNFNLGIYEGCRVFAMSRAKSKGKPAAIIFYKMAVG